MRKARLATTWLEGCSGCHMSIFDMDERLLQIADMAEIVYTPLVDTKKYPKDVDIVLIEGGIGNEEQQELIHIIRDRTKTLVSLGDCAVTSNIVAYRNPVSVSDLYKHIFAETSDNQVEPGPEVPKLLPYCVPVHEIVNVEVFVPGCPPSADLIFKMLTDLIEGREPETLNRFG
ncbi:MAG: NADH-quinone oxidoreductase subunit B family protein [Candidatus Aquicultorales bacterium]